MWKTSFVFNVVGPRFLGGKTTEVSQDAKVGESKPTMNSSNR